MTATAPDAFGLGWTRAADALAARIAVEEIEKLWVFPRLRREEREWGTAVAATDAGEDRLRIYTARYMLIVRGKEKGQGRVEVSEIGTSSPDTLEEVLRGVQDRAGEADPPTEIDPELWYGGEDDEPAS